MAPCSPIRTPPPPPMWCRLPPGPSVAPSSPIWTPPPHVMQAAAEDQQVWMAAEFTANLGRIGEGNTGEGGGGVKGYSGGQNNVPGVGKIARMCGDGELTLACFPPPFPPYPLPLQAHTSFNTCSLISRWSSSPGPSPTSSR